MTTVKRRPYWCSKPVVWELNLLPMRNCSIVPILYTPSLSYLPYSIRRELEKNISKCKQTIQSTLWGCYRILGEFRPYQGGNVKNDKGPNAKLRHLSLLVYYLLVNLTCACIHVAGLGVLGTTTLTFCTTPRGRWIGACTHACL